MTPHYPYVWAQIQRATRFDKYASEGADAAVDLARVASEVFEDVLLKSASYGASDTPHHVAANMAAFAVDLFDSARATGAKTASENDATDAIEQLATVAYLDTMLKSASANLSGEALDTAYRAQLLGREYGVELLRSLVG